MRIGISTYLYGNPDSKTRHAESWQDVLPILNRVKGAGYDYVELSSRTLPHPFSVQQDDMQRVAEFLDSLPLTVYALHLEGGCSHSICSPDAMYREEALEYFERSMTAYGPLRPQCVTIHPPRHNTHLVQPYRRIVDAARSKGCKLGLERGSSDVASMKQMIETIGEEDIGILLDTGHCWDTVHAGVVVDPADEIREAGSLLYALHAHDNHGELDEHLIPGEGTIDWKHVVDALKDVSYKGVFGMECTSSLRTQDKDMLARQAREAAERLLTDA